MKPLQGLHEEHQLIKRALVVLEHVAHRANAGAQIELGLVRQALQFIHVLIEQCHHAKEEQALFPLLAAKSELIASGPLHILKADHAASTRLLERIEEALGRLEADDTAANAHLVTDIEWYVRLERRHIDLEDDVIVKLSNALILQEEADVLDKQFSAIERELGPISHNLFVDVLKDLEHQAGVRLTAA